MIQTKVINNRNWKVEDERNKIGNISFSHLTSRGVQILSKNNYTGKTNKKGSK